MSKHSKEPWWIDETPNVDNCYWIEYQGKYAPLQIGEIAEKSDAQRIVECVNAMAGIEDPEGFMRDLKVLLNGIKDRSETNMACADILVNVAMSEHKPKESE